MNSKNLNCDTGRRAICAHAVKRKGKRIAFGGKGKFTLPVKLQYLIQRLL